jgi:hypothetical protein
LLVQQLALPEPQQLGRKQQVTQRLGQKLLQQQEQQQQVLELVQEQLAFRHKQRETKPTKRQRVLSISFYICP